MAADYVFSFGIDAAPTVTSTTPTNGAPQVAADTNVTINFSESVNAGGASFDITCATSGTHTFTTSASPSATFTLNPNADFTQGETCTVTVFATGVTDADAFDPPDNMAADYVFTFTIDEAPAVLSTNPTNGATDIGGATNVIINFSESVNATVASFDITCGTSGTHTFTTSATPSTTFTLDPTADFVAGETCTVTAFAAGITDADLVDPPDNMLANYVFSFTIDVAPSVTAVTPLDTATGVATNTNLSVTFSEPVTITNSSVTISCANTGAHTVAVSGGPTVWTVDPTTDFGNGELCTATVLAAQVSDNDGNDPPDNMLANFVWSFTTDTPPSVTTTTPANAGTTAPDTNIDITFNEAVNATGSSFTISCTTSGSHAFNLSGGPTTFTLDPTTDFTGGETCTVTVVAAQVTDQDAGDPPDNMAADYVLTFGIDAAPTVTSTTPTNGAPQVASNTNVTINFSESVNATGTSFTISCATSGAHTFTTSASPSATFTLNPNVDFTPGELCTVTVVAANVTDADAFDPPNNMAADYVFSFTIDEVPTVLSTNPSNGATDIGGATNVTINFSESVNAAGASFDITCATSGAHTFTTSASPSASFTLNPNTDFVAGETCTVTAFAAGITDADAFDPPDNMAANYVFSFTIDVAPSVTAVTPLNSATNVATNTNLSVTFSEPVTITNSSVTISCANTGAHTVTVSGGPTIWTVDPTSDFGNGELCTATVLAAQVSDNDTNDPPDNMAANFVWSFTTDNPPSVTATTPTNGGVAAPTANVSVTFSESVSATGSSFTISCTTSGSHTFVLSGGPTTWTLDPNADFTGGETCTVTVVAANVSDSDAGDPPDNMTGDYVFSFTVDAAPTVTSTTPTNGAPQAASNTNVTINFSESVNATGTSFTISCATSGAHTFTTSASPSATFTLNPNVDFTPGELCTVTVVAANVTDADANDPPDNMAADYVFSFTVDNAPSVSATTPTNGALGQTSNTNVSITFSEPVNATGASFTISCTVSGAHAFALSGGPTAWTLDPTADFTQGETCTVTALAAQITDTDAFDPPDNMAANYVFSFTIDATPSVTATTPVDLATQQANNTSVTVTFSEPVNATGASFTISCTVSGAHPYALSGGPTTWTLDPTTDFTNGETCTVTAVAAQITDTDTNDPPDNMAANYVFSFSIDTPPAVTTTAPIGGGTISPSTAITVNFNESVNATTSSFTVNCGGAQTYTLSSSPSTSFTLTPTTIWTAGACTLTVVAAQITDADSGDPPDNPIADTVVNFTVNTPPVAKDDVEYAIGNLTLTVSDANGVILDGGNDDDDGVGGNDATDGKDTDSDPGSSITIQALGPLTGSAGGSLTFTSGGGYTYHSEAGDANVDDVFTYTIVDNNGATDTGQLTIHVGPRYLFVDAAFAGAPKDGRDTNPFQTLQQAEAGSAANDTFVVKQGSYTDFITLKAGQVMYGDGATAALTVTHGGKLFTLLTPTGTHPGLKRSTAGNTITLSATGNNTLSGIDVSASSAGAAIGSGATFGTLTTNQNTRIGVTTVNSAGALALTSGILAATFPTVNSTAGTNGISLTTCTGSLTISGGTITGATGSTFNVSGGSVGVTMGAAITQANGANVVTIASTNSSTINFNGNVQSSATSTGISISGSSGTYNFNGATNSLAGSGGAVAIAGESGTILFSAGTAITAAGTSFKLSGTSTANITYNGTISNTANGGIVLDINNTTAGAYSVGTISFSGPSVSVVGSSNGNSGVLSVINNMAGTLFVKNFSETANNNNYANTLVLIGGTNTGGSFTFDNLDLQANGSNHDGKGLVMSGGGTLALITTSGTNTIDVGNTALSLTGVAVSPSSIATLSSLGDPLASAVILSTVTGGTLTIGGGTITCNTAACFAVTNGSVSVTNSATISQGTAFPAVSVIGHATGTLAFSGNITASVNDADLFFDNADGTYNFNATNALTTGAGINITNGSGGTFSFSANTSVTNGLVDATDNACFRVDASAPNVTYSGNLTKNGAITGRLVDIAGQTGGTITFLTGTLSATSTSGTSTGIGLDNADGTVNFNGTTTLNGGDAGIDVINGSGGTIVFAETASLTSPTGIGFNIDASSANVTYSGSFTKSNTGIGINVTNNTGGTVTFDGDSLANGGDGAIETKVLSTSTSNAINFTGNNSATTLLFTGSTLNVTTSTGRAFNATSAGTVRVAGTVNTLTSTTGTALFVQNVTIGTGGLNFKSIAANGATNGVYLENTGTTAGLTVTGDGSVVLGGNSSGGTIQSSSGNGIRLINTLSPSFNNITITTSAGSGIKGSGNVQNFTLTYSSISGSNDSALDGGVAGENTVDEANVAFNDNQAPATQKNITGTVTITNNSLTTALYHGIDIYNYDGTLSDVTISNNTVTSTASTVTSKGNGIRLIAFGSASTIANVTKATISNNTVSNFPSGAGIMAQGGNGNAAGAAGVFGQVGNATNKISITGNSLNGGATKFATQAILAVVNGKGQGNFNISSNPTVTNSIGTAIAVSSLGNANVTADIKSNVIVANNTIGSTGIGAGTSSTFGTSDTPTLTVTIESNNISQTDGNGILATARDATGQLNVTIKSNTVAAPLGGIRPGIRVDAGNAVSVDDAVCADIQSNTSAGSGGSLGIGLRKQGTVSTTHDFGVEGMAATATPNVESYVAGLNPSGGGVFLISGTSGFINCGSAP
jgi:methionine-rich copper-binding protein CopC